MSRKKVLITGGSGTVGRAFIAAFRNEFDFSVVSRNEKMQHELKQSYREVECYLGAIDNREALFNIYDKVRPDIVIHAAAMKHVDLAEKDPNQTVRINVVGSLNVIDASVAFDVPVTVAISTDKACNHQNIYGMSKFMMERCFMHANAGRNRFSACRFANVAHSNGSVIPLWLKMHAEGKPLRITDPSMNRMMFSQLDAAKLIRRAVSMTEDGDGAFILTRLMKNVNILDLAHAISDRVEVVGSRPGEKMNEDLVAVNELPFTKILDDDYVRIGQTVNDDLHSRLLMPLNSLTAEQMTATELTELVYPKE